MANRNRIKIGVIIIEVIVIGAVGYFIFSGKQTISPSTMNTSGSSPTSMVDISDWRTYTNGQYGFEFMYPNKLGWITDAGKDAYFLNTYRFSGENQSVSKVSIATFTDKSVNDWGTAVQNSINNNEPVGDPALLPYPLSVKTLLTTKPIGYDCTADFGGYLDKKNNESCQIADINGIRTFKIIATGPFQSEVSEIKYLFYVNNAWFDFSKRFWIYSKNDPNKQLYAFEQLNSVLQGKASNAPVQVEIDTFNQILSTFKFISTNKVLPLEILSPKGGEVWLLGSIQTIRWTGGNQNNVKIVLEVHSYGASETVIATSIPNTGSYTWQIPTNLVLTDTNLIRIEQASSNPNLGEIKVKSNYFSIEGEKK